MSDIKSNKEKAGIGENWKEEILKELREFGQEMRDEWKKKIAKSRREKGLDRENFEVIMEKMREEIRKLSFCRSMERGKGRP